MLELVTTTTIPLALAVGAGWALGRYRDVPAAPLATVGVDVLGPALVIGAVPRDLVERLDLFLLLLAAWLVLMAVAYAAAWALRITDRDSRTGFVYAVAFANFGFLGLPVVEFVLGEGAFQTGIAVLTFLNIPTGIVAVYMASPNPAVGPALKHTLKVPFTWAVAAALVLGITGWELPVWLQRPLELLGEGAIPVLLLVLGLQLGHLKLGRVRPAVLGGAVALRLLVSPLVVWLLVRGMGIDAGSLTAQCAVLQLATPPGLTPLLFMVAFGRDTTVHAAAVVVGTVAAVATLPVVAALLT